MSNTATAKRTRRSYGISRDDFIQAWEPSTTGQEAADKLTAIARKNGKLKEDEVIPKNIVLSRAAIYRKQGVQLKKMDKKNPNKLNIEQMNAKVKEVRETQTAGASQ